MPPIDGTPGNDNLIGTPDADIINGLDGDDVIEGLEGDDTIDGGAGNDTASYASASGAVSAFLGTSFGSSEGAAGFDSLANIENLTGSGYDDQLVGNQFDNVLDGLAGSDQLLGRQGNDIISGGDGADFIYGHQGDDTLDGGEGHDFFRAGTGNDIVNGGNGFDRLSHFQSGNDIITSGVTVSLMLQGMWQDTGQGLDFLTGIEALSGTPFDDSLTGDNGANWLIAADSDGVGGNDQLYGLGGNDLIEVAAGNHLVDGGGDNDTLSFLGLTYTPGGVNVSLLLQGAAQDTGQGLMTISNIENLSGTAFADTLTGDASDNQLFGDEGDDTLRGGAGSDMLYGDGSVRADTAGLGGSGPITAYEDVADSLGLTSGNDLIEGGLGDDHIYGGGGIDTASYANAGGSIEVALGTAGGFADGADGFDTLSSIENVVGSAFDDILGGNNGSNVLDGGAGHDLIYGRGGDDELVGGDGDDFLRGSDGADILNGGSGWDRVSSFVAAPTAGISFDLNIQGVAQDTGQGMDVLIGIEHASGTVLNDRLTGDGGDNWLWDGSDGVAGGGTGDDNLSAGAGNDLVETGGGNDVLAGGTGTDTLSFFGGNVEIGVDGVTFSLALQGAAQATEQGSITASGFENVSGSIHDDSLTGDGGANLLAGDIGNDALSGGDGDDALYGDGRVHVDLHGIGGSGSITLFGDAAAEFALAAGNDTLNGGKGDDDLYGGMGNDVMTGGLNSDRFIIEANSGNDTITDFKSVDTILFDGSSGVDDFSDLILTAAPGNSTLISWGTGDSILVQGVKPNQLDASDFEFGAAAVGAASSARGASLHAGFEPMEHAREDLAFNDLFFG